MTKGIENTLGLRSLEEALAAFGAKAPAVDEIVEQAPYEMTVDLNDDLERFEQEHHLDLPDDFDQRVALSVSTKRREELAEDLLSGKDSEDKLDFLYGEFLTHSRTLTDLALELDPARAPRAFEVANAFIKHAMDAVSTKRDNQLKTMKLMLDQKRMELEERKLNNAANNGGEGVIQAQATVMATSTADMLRDMHKAMKAQQEADEAAIAARAEAEKNA